MAQSSSDLRLLAELYLDDLNWLRRKIGQYRKEFQKRERDTIPVQVAGVCRGLAVHMIVDPFRNRTAQKVSRAASGSVLKQATTRMKQALESFLRGHELELLSAKSAVEELTNAVGQLAAELERAIDEAERFLKAVVAV